MTEKPSNVLQFQNTNKLTPEEHRRIRQYYFSGCGPNQDFWPKRHRWGKWETVKTSVGHSYKERTCLTCSEVSDRVYEDGDE